MNKWVKLGVMSITMLGLAGCGQSQEKSSTKPKTETQKTTAIDINGAKDDQEYKITPDTKGRVTVKGTSTPGAKITASDGKKTFGKTKADKDGNYTINVKGLNHYTSDVFSIVAKKEGMKEDYYPVNINDTKARQDYKDSQEDSDDEAYMPKVEPYNKVAYDELNRNPDKYDSKKLEITGDVIQTIEDDDDSSANGALVAMDGNTDNVVMVVYGKDDTANGERILEDDNVTVLGIGAKTFSYNAESGDRVTVPAVSASNITRN
jgi:hypothetical protein